MKKRLCLLLLSGALSISMMAGCGSKVENSNTDELTDGSTEAAEEVEPSEQEVILPEEEPIEETSAEDSAAEEEQADSTAAAEGVTLNVEEPLTGLHHAQIDVADYGTITLELDADTAPISVTNFVKLAQEGFYDGLTFHRIMAGFMIQGGDPLGNGTGGSDQTIKGEFSQNGVENKISHERGVISMARSNNPDSASSQFFICHADSDFLDGQYAAFGHVTEGMDVVDAIAEKAEPTDSNGTIPADQQPKMNSVIVLD